MLLGHIGEHCECCELYIEYLHMDEKYMKLALEEAKKSLNNNIFPVGAVLVKNGEIIAKTHKTSDVNFHLGHAEISALSIGLKGAASKRKSSIVLYTTVEPCVMCWGTILHCPVDRLVYAAKEPWGGATKYTDLPIRHKGKLPEVVGGVLEKESVELLKQFLKVSKESWLDEANPLSQYIKEF